ncbi:hypothetical protein SAMN04487948_10286 [Halogranum amylolyticum]|uniref:Lysylphosphatidylglycerol synthase TM region n=1 Tax=Halogranum amylolyticum TaxID=660520 RepID=A0A1H8P4E7_9EURY|nr:lysylphosphatidylglycerol synthase transmembrane domain-containing protein [Halogranum amylolyticum]SEO36722.1 hypothetical protein SAMN04487948_10286 [Halogranum amylolyticum]
MSQVARTTVDRETGVKVLASFAAASVLLYFFGAVIGWGEIIATLRKAKLEWLVVACLSSTLCLVIWAKSWDVIFGAVDVDIPLSALVPTYFAGTFADYVTPFGKAGGGPFIAYILSTDGRVSYQESLAGVVIADLLNMLPFFTFAGFGFVALFVQGSVPPRAEPLVGGLALLAFGIPVAVYLGWRHRQVVELLVVGLSRPIAARTSRVDVDSLKDRVDEFYDRLDRIAAHPKELAITLAYSYVGWLFFAAPLFLAGQTIGVHIDPALVLFIVPASTLAGVAPTPGGLGGVEVAIVGLLVALTTVNTATAAAIALVYRVASYWYVLGLSGIAALYEIYTH